MREFTEKKTRFQPKLMSSLRILVITFASTYVDFLLVHIFMTITNAKKLLGTLNSLFRNMPYGQKSRNLFKIFTQSMSFIKFVILKTIKYFRKI